MPTPSTPFRRPAKTGTGAKSRSPTQTDSGPSQLPPASMSDAAAQKLAQTEALAAAMPFNANKPQEHGLDNGLAPPAGQHVQPASVLPTASTLTEDNGSEKTGSQAIEGLNATIEPLDRVRVDSQGRHLTTNQGVAVADNQNSLKSGTRGPALLEDFILREKITHFDHERIPERVVHARGSAAHGFFECYEALTDVTKAAPFQEAGKQTPVFVRFSTVIGERGSKDTARDVRGFAVKFYTEEGNWDLVGNNTPVFFIRDPLKFPDLNHAVKRDPRTNMRSAKNNWDFWTSLPEALHQVTIVMSERGIPASYRHMHGFGSHTFSLINAGNVRYWVKFHFITQQGIKNLTDEDAETIIGKDRESHQRDLYESIEKGEFPRWQLKVQVMPEADAVKVSYNPFDLTKVWPHKDYPLIDVGIMELNRNPENFFAEVEQAAFNPADVVPGIGFSPDKVLQGRLFAYGDAQRYRLGVNHHSIPVNAPRCPVHSYHRDGSMRVDGNYGSRLSYNPNTSGEWAEQPEYCEPPLNLTGAADHWNHREDTDYFSQPGKLFRLMSPAQQQVLFDNTARSLRQVPREIQVRHIQHCLQADQVYGEGISKALGISLRDVSR